MSMISCYEVIVIKDKNRCEYAGKTACCTDENPGTGKQSVHFLYKYDTITCYDL